MNNSSSSSSSSINNNNSIDSSSSSTSLSSSETGGAIRAAQSSNLNVNDNGEEDENLKIKEEFSLWKGNCHLLYDTVITYPLEWSSPTIQWVPFDKVAFSLTNSSNSILSNNKNKKDFVEHGLLIGTNSGVESDFGNRLYFLGVKLPHPDAEIKVEKYDETDGLGGYQGSLPKVEIYAIINHKGDVNRARVQPVEKSITATRSSNGFVYIFDKTKHPSLPSDDDLKVFKPQAICSGLIGDSFALDWNPMPHNRNLIISADENNIGIWNIEGNSFLTKAIDAIAPLHIITNAHENGVGDVQWNRFQASTFASCGNDSNIKLWDIRKDAPTNVINNAHTGDVNCLAFSPHSEHMFASGGNIIKLWDLRNLSQAIHELVNDAAIEEQIYQLSWSPHNESMLASCGSSRRTNIWDISKIGEEKSIKRGNDEENDDKNVPPELVFSHGGHTSTVTDVSWNEQDDYTLATVASDNILQIWQISESIFEEQEETAENDAPPRKKQATINENDLE